MYKLNTRRTMARLVVNKQIERLYAAINILVIAGIEADMHNDLDTADQYDRQINMLEAEIYGLRAAISNPRTVLARK
jgi:hypothetical protein